MADTDDSFHLRLFSLATFHAASFVVAVMLSFHLRGALPSALQRLDTATGFAAFGLFWTTTWFATRAGLLNVRRDDTGSDSFVASTVVAAGWNGLYVFAALFVVVLLFALVGAPAYLARGGPIGPILTLFLIGSTLGSLVAFVIGGLVGLIYGLAEAALFGVSAALFRWTDVSAKK